MSATDLSSVVLDFSTGTYSVTRSSGPGTYDADGLVVPADTETLQVEALITPLLGGPQLLRLPEGRRSIDAIEIFTPTLLFVEAPAQTPDVVSYNGHLWQVDVVDDWFAAGAFYHALATKTPDGGGIEV